MNPALVTTLVMCMALFMWLAERRGGEMESRKRLAIIKTLLAVGMYASSAIMAFQILARAETGVAWSAVAVAIQAYTSYLFWMLTFRLNSEEFKRANPSAWWRKAWLPALGIAMVLQGAAGGSVTHALRSLSAPLWIAMPVGIGFMYVGIFFVYLWALSL